MKGVKVRSFPEHNYKAIYHNGKTLRLQYDPTKPITDLEFPEFYDLKITSYCEGQCPWCYMDSSDKHKHVSDLVKKVETFFGQMSENERPFQVAIGGGEPTTHPEFIPLLEKLRELGISPNYTTNGMHMTNEILDATMKYCEGVAVSCHPHLQKYWKLAFNALVLHGVKTNFHIIISDKKSIDYFDEIFQEYYHSAFYFVLLPYEATGRAKEKEKDFDYLFELLKQCEDVSKVAFGALFHPHLKSQRWLDLSLYETEIMSAFLDCSNMCLYKSSFNTKEEIKKAGWFHGEGSSNLQDSKQAAG